MNLTPGGIQEDLDRLMPLFESSYLDAFHSPEAPRVTEAAIYSLKAGGKRVRPMLCMLATEASGAPAALSLPCATALEYVHTYSLIHDDLPAMDDDDLRRGKPTCHKVFGEGQAILAGDGLLTEAFRVLAVDGTLPPEARVEAMAVLADASGFRGMVGGQSLDLEGEALTRQGESYDLVHLQHIHRLKTGALIRAALELGAIAAGAHGEVRGLLREAGAAMGLAFQIQDDLLDATSSAEHMGKRVGKDAAKGKITYPLLLGIEGSKIALLEASNLAKERISLLPHPDRLLVWVQFLAERSA